MNRPLLASNFGGLFHEDFESEPSKAEGSEVDQLLPGKGERKQSVQYQTIRNRCGRGKRRRRLNRNHAFSTVNCLGVGFKNPAQTYREGEEFTRIFRQRVTSILAEDYGIRGVVPAVDSAWDVKGALKSMYGSFLFLGILLGMVFLFATVLIIYYKQISEGYEDRKRFQIMEKVGMSPGEVKKTIQSQVRMVFFLPLMVAGVHTAVAFPILIELLKS